MHGPGDSLNTGNGAQRLHGLVNMPIHTSFRNIEDLTYFKGALASGTPSQAFELPFGQLNVVVDVLQFWLTLYWRYL